MKEKFTLLIAFLIFFFLKTGAQIYDWSKAIGGSGTDNGNSLAVDNSGSLYITGKFDGTADFDPSASTANLVSNGNSDAFLAKYNADGEYVWAFNIGGYAADAGSSIIIDPSGNIIISGSFQGPADFDPSYSTSTLTALAYEDVFMAKYDSSGALIWAKSIKGQGYDNSFCIKTDNSGKIYVTGRFNKAADFDPSLGDFSINSVNNSIDIFLAHYDSSGNFIWVKSFGGTGSEIGYSVAVKDSSVFLTGLFSDVADFDGGSSNFTLISNGNWDVFIARYDTSGNFIWANSMGSSNDDIAFSIAVDDDNNLYFCGQFRDTVDFNSDSAVFNLISNGSADFFLASYDKGGNFRWAKGMGGSSIDNATSLSISSSSQILLNGIFYDVVDFDPSASVASLSSLGQDMFIAVYDLSGNYINAKNPGGGNEQYASSIVEKNSTIYMCGYFYGSANFEGNMIYSAGSADILMAKYHLAGCAATLSSIDTSLCQSYTSPAGNVLTISGIYYDTLQNAGGCDSIITINLTIWQASSSQEIISACKTFTWIDGITYTSDNNTATFTLTNSMGCDSIITLNLTVTTPDTSVVLSGTTLTSGSSESYQWIDCSNYQLIANATSQAYTPGQTGSYAVVVTEDGCTDTSSCYQIIVTSSDDELLRKNVFVYQGISRGEFIVVNGIRVPYEITDVAGKQIRKGMITYERDFINLVNSESGIYFLKIEERVFRLLNY